MISRIGAVSYRCFSHLDIEVRSHCVLAGANGIGKSTLVDIPFLVGDITRWGVQRSFLEPLREGQGPRAQLYREILHRGQGDHCVLVLEAALPSQVQERLRGVAPPRARNNLPTHIRYEVRLRLMGERELLVETEYLDLFPKSARSADLTRVSDPHSAGWRPVIERQRGARATISAEYRRSQITPDELSPDQLALSSIGDELLFPASIWFLRLLREGIVTYSPDCGKLRQARPPEPTREIRGDAANLPWQVFQLQKDPALLAEWLHVVRLALPNVMDIRAVEREEDHHAYLRVTYRFGDAGSADHAVTSSGLSDGTLRILAYTLLPYLEKLPPLLAIEQPEDGIHPRAIDVVLESLSSLTDTQTLVTTHSTVVMARTPLENLICLRRDEQGAAEAVNGPRHPRLQQWQQELDLGALFAAGVLS